MVRIFWPWQICQLCFSFGGFDNCLRCVLSLISDAVDEEAAAEEERKRGEEAENELQEFVNNLSPEDKELLKVCDDVDIISVLVIALFVLENCCTQNISITLLVVCRT